MTKPKAYSYIRFSTPEQMRGDSLRRQTEAAERYAATHGLDLDLDLTFRDLGVSAYQGANEEEGHLGEFLAAVRYGDIKPGSFLLVESLDRLSRQRPRRAVRTLERICEEGITVVTLDDQRAYTEAVLDEDPTALLVAILVAARAHEESATKARRLREAWKEKRKKASSQPLTRICPAWMRLQEDRSGFDLIPERAEVIKRVFRMTLDGAGQHSIAETFNRERLPLFGRGRFWQRSYIKKILENPATIGTYVPHSIDRTGGRKTRTALEPVEDYFPAVVDRETFERVQLLASGRAATGTRTSGKANILAGLATCPLCGSTMTRVNKGRKKGGKPYLVCTSAKAGAGCEYHQIKMDRIEGALTEGAEELIADMPSTNDDLQTQWENIGEAISATEDAIRNIVEIVEGQGAGPHSKALMARLVELEGTLDDLKGQQAGVAGRIAATLTNRTMTIADDDFLASVRAGDVAKVNAALRQLFERVVVNYRTGFLEMHWKHADAYSEVGPFTMPTT